MYFTLWYFSRDDLAMLILIVRWVERSTLMTIKKYRTRLFALKENETLLSFVFFFLQPKKKPTATEWVKLDESPVFKNDNTLREYQLEGLNWLLFSWYNG